MSGNVTIHGEPQLNSGSPIASRDNHVLSNNRDRPMSDSLIHHKRATTSKSARFVQIINVVGYILVISFNIASNAPSKPFNGKTNADVSKAHKTAFTPAGYAFSIWGLIFTLQAIFTIYQLFKSQRAYVWTRINLVYAVNCVAVCVWLVTFAYEALWVSFGVLFGIIWTTTATLYWRIGEPSAHLYASVKSAQTSKFKRTIAFLGYRGFTSIYFGWTTVAAFANLAIAITSESNTWGWSQSNWTIVLLCLITTFAVFISSRYLDVMFPLTVAWAFFAIGVQQRSDEYPGNRQVVNCAFSLGGILCLISLVVGIKNAWSCHQHKHDNHDTNRQQTRAESW